MRRQTCGRKAHAGPASLGDLTLQASVLVLHIAGLPRGRIVVLGKEQFKSQPASMIKRSM